VAALQDSGIADQACKAARRKSSSRKTEKKNLIAFLVILAEKPVTSQNIVKQAATDGAAADFDSELGADTVNVADHLLNPVLVGGQKSARDFGDVSRARRTVVGFAFGIPGAVGTHD
jgi:hypothetical protein